MDLVWRGFLEMFGKFFGIPPKILRVTWFGDFDGLSNFLEVMTSDLENFWCAGGVLAFFGARKKCFNRRFCRVLEFFVVGL